MVRRIVTIGLVLAAFAAIFYAGTLGSDPAEVRAADDAVERLIPTDGSPVVIRQAEIGVDLAPGWTGVLVIDGTEIPEDQLRRVEAENQLFFQPGVGKVFEALPEGEHVAVAEFWRTATETRADARSVTWQFRVA